MGKKSRKKSVRVRQEVGGRGNIHSFDDVDCDCFACTKKGWVAGPGVSSENRDRKDYTRVTKAQKRNQPRDVIIDENDDLFRRRLMD